MLSPACLQLAVKHQTGSQSSRIPSLSCGAVNYPSVLGVESIAFSALRESVHLCLSLLQRQVSN